MYELTALLKIIICFMNQFKLNVCKKIMKKNVLCKIQASKTLKSHVIIFLTELGSLPTQIK